MIKLIHGHQRQEFPELIHQMHVIRKEIFHDRLAWDVETIGDWEIDSFDECDPLYLLSIDVNGGVRGSLRLLPTTGPNMLADVFHCLLKPGRRIECPTIWESSRFCVSYRNAIDRQSLKAVNYVTAELIAAMGEVGMMAGLSKVVTVYDRHLRKIISRAGCVETLVGGPVKIGDVQTFAGLFQINRSDIDEFRMKWGIGDDLFADDGVRQSMLAA